MKSFWSGFISAIAALFLVALFVTGAGWTPIAATWMQDQAWLKTPLAFISRQAIESSAEERSNPFANQVDAMIEGAEEFSSHCLHCHGTQNVKAAEWARGLVPDPPNLDTDRMQSLTDAQMFWVIKNGIHSTGMPHFAEEEDEEIWQIVAFMSAYPDLPEEVQREWEKATETDDGHSH